MNLNLGLESLVVVKQPVVQQIDLVLALDEYLTCSAELSDMLTGYQNADAVLKLKKAGKLTPDMLELIGVENMQAIAAMEADTAIEDSRWYNIRMTMRKAWDALVKFIKGLFARIKLNYNKLAGWIKEKNLTNVTVSKICKEPDGATPRHIDMLQTSTLKKEVDAGIALIQGYNVEMDSRIIVNRASKLPYVSVNIKEAGYRILSDEKGNTLLGGGHIPSDTAVRISIKTELQRISSTFGMVCRDMASDYQELDNIRTRCEQAVDKQQFLGSRTSDDPSAYRTDQRILVALAMSLLSGVIKPLLLNNTRDVALLMSIVASVNGKVTISE